jgi:hypothetical protein
MDMKLASKTIFPLCIAIFASMYACKEKEEIVPDGWMCGAGFFTINGICACPPRTFQFGEAPTEHNTPGVGHSTGMCIAFSPGAEAAFLATSDCKCTSLTNNTADTFVLKFLLIENASQSLGKFVGSYHKSGFYGEDSGYVIRHENGEEIRLRMWNSFSPDYARYTDCLTHHPGIEGNMSLFFPKGEQEITGQVLWRSIDSSIGILDSCTITLERLFP